MRNTEVNGAVEIDFLSDKEWAVTVDKLLDFGWNTHLPTIQFSIMEVPISIAFEAPIRLKADAYLKEHA